MKVAVDQTGSPVWAKAGAPWQALCPFCGGPMTLRCRQRSSRSSDVTYFWRHQDNTNLDCRARFSVTNAVRTDGGLRMR